MPFNKHKYSNIHMHTYLNTGSDTNWRKCYRSILEKLIYAYEAKTLYFKNLKQIRKTKHITYVSIHIFLVLQYLICMWLNFHATVATKDRIQKIYRWSIFDKPAIWCRVRCFPRLVTDPRKSQPSMWYHVLSNRSPISTNTHSVGRVYGNRNLYTHYELVWYKNRE